LAPKKLGVGASAGSVRKTSRGGIDRKKEKCRANGAEDDSQPLPLDESRASGAQRDFSLRKPTGSQEQAGRKSVGLLRSE